MMLLGIWLDGQEWWPEVLYVVIAAIAAIYACAVTCRRLLAWKVEHGRYMDLEAAERARAEREGEEALLERQRIEIANWKDYQASRSIAEIRRDAIHEAANREREAARAAMLKVRAHLIPLTSHLPLTHLTPPSPMQ